MVCEGSGLAGEQVNMHHGRWRKETHLRSNHVLLVGCVGAQAVQLLLQVLQLRLQALDLLLDSLL